MPAFNSAAFIGEALDSVLSQTCAVTEIIVVDDDSTDATLEVLSRYPQVKRLRQKHKGPSAARNAGIQHAQGQYIAFLDSDDLWFPDKIERQMVAFSIYPDAVFSFASFWFFGTSDIKGIPSETYCPKELGVWLASQTAKDGMACGDVYRLLLRANCVNTSSVVVRRDAVIAAGMFDVSMTHGEDHDLWLRLARRWPAVFITDPNSKVRIHPSELSGAWSSRQGLFYRSTIETLTKHGRAFPSREASRALAYTYNNYAMFQLKARQWADAKRLTEKGLRIMPTLAGFRLWLEAVFPRAYSYAVGMLRGNQIS